MRGGLSLQVRKQIGGDAQLGVAEQLAHLDELDVRRDEQPAMAFGLTTRVSAHGSPASKKRSASPNTRARLGDLTDS
jgi:hypothetical protein